MKKLIVFILLLVNSYSFACGFYPYGEDVRMSFLRSSHFNCQLFKGFYYSSYTYSDPSIDFNKLGIHPNDDLWFDYCQKKVPIEAILEAVNKIPEGDFNEKNSNKMIHYLFHQKDFLAINYLKFAKSCEIANMFYSDPWERKDKVEISIIKGKINDALKLANQSNKEQIKMRYKFLAIRLAYYGGINNEIIEIYNSIPKTNKPNIINFWCMHFRTIVENDKALQSFYAAQVFANATDKRFPIYSFFDTSIDINLILKNAKTNEEKANVYAIAASKKSDKALEYIKKAFQLNPKSDFNIFILLREVNKIEDWVLTPYYTNFNPSTSSNEDDSKIFSYKALEKRISKDRKYAAELLTFLNSLKKSTNQIDVCKAQLSFISQKYNGSLKILKSVEIKVSKKDSLYNDIQIVKALTTTANQQKNNAIITKEVQSILLKNKTNKRFLFAIARELEYLENTTDAAFLFSKINDNEHDYGSLAWKSRKHKRGSYQDYFSDYFGYVDVLYTPKQLEEVINKSEIATNDNEFDSWVKSRLISEKSRLFDLLGTKYIRQNNLEKAVKAFKKIDDKYWNDYYSLWEIKSYEGNSFDKNPFFGFKYTPDFMKDKENFYVTKVTFTQKLIEYLKKANNPKEKERDYYYFLAANGYKNMTVNGNSWMMRRFSVSSYDVEPFPEDEQEFQKELLAKKYYHLAYKYAKTKKFKALCLWLAEDYKKLKQTQKEEYFDLSDNNCYAFEEYFNSGK